MDIRVDGIEEVYAKLTQLQQDLHGAGMVEIVNKIVLYLSRAAKLNLQPWGGPGTGGVDTGALRASILPSVTTGGAGQIVQGVVGSNLAYAPFQEYPTRPRYIAARFIGQWAERHGMGYRGIFVSGRGLKFLGRAVSEGLSTIANIIAQSMASILNKR